MKVIINEEKFLAFLNKLMNAELVVGNSHDVKGKEVVAEEVMAYLKQHKR